MNRFSSIFSNLQPLFLRVEFRRLVTVTQPERHVVGSPVGANLQPCCSAHWAGPTLKKGDLFSCTNNTTVRLREESVN